MGFKHQELLRRRINLEKKISATGLKGIGHQELGR